LTLFAGITVDSTLCKNVAPSPFGDIHRHLDYQQLNSTLVPGLCASTDTRLTYRASDESRRRSLKILFFMRFLTSPISGLGNGTGFAYGGQKDCECIHGENKVVLARFSSHALDAD
jgi:hypothetical protein